MKRVGAEESSTRRVHRLGQQISCKQLVWSNKTKHKSNFDHLQQKSLPCCDGHWGQQDQQYRNNAQENIKGESL